MLSTSTGAAAALLLTSASAESRQPESGQQMLMTTNGGTDPYPIPWLDKNGTTTSWRERTWINALRFVAAVFCVSPIFCGLVWAILCPPELGHESVTQDESGVQGSENKEPISSRGAIPLRLGVAAKSCQGV
jgi:hypothetical protein